MIGTGQAFPAVRNLPAVSTGLAGVVALAVLGLLRFNGNTGFPTDPLGALALAVGALGAMLAASRLLAAGNRRAGRMAQWLGASLLGYLLSAAWAVWAVATGHGSAPLAVACWSTAWLPPLGLMQVTASAAVRADDRAPWTHRILLAAVGAATLLNPVLTTSAEPFTGLPTIAPESWQTTLAPLGGVVTLLGAVALLLIPASLWRAALGSQGTFVAMNNVVSQSVAHLHCHIVPRTKGDGLKGFFWPRTKYTSDEAMREAADKIRAALV